jgi:hypothetical protein
MQLDNTMRNTPSHQHYRATLNHIPNILPPAQKHSSTLPPVHSLPLTFFITPLLKNIQTQIPIPLIPNSLSTFNPKKNYSKKKKKFKVELRVSTPTAIAIFLLGFSTISRFAGISRKSTSCNETSFLAKTLISPKLIWPV